MAALAGSGNHGSLNGTNHVEIVATPGIGVFRMIRALYVNHTDSNPAVLHIAKKVGISEYQVHSQNMLHGHTVEFGDGDSIILVNGETLVAWLDSAPGTNPTFVVSFGDK